MNYYENENNENYHPEIFLTFNPNDYNQIIGKYCITNEDNLKLEECHKINLQMSYTYIIKSDSEINKGKGIYKILIEGIFLYGTFEIYNIKNIRILNINESYFFPYIDNYTSSNFLIFNISNIEKNIFINILNENENNNCSSLFLYENNFDLRICNESNYDKPKYYELIKGKNYTIKFKPLENNRLVINFMENIINEISEKELTYLSLDNSYFFFIINIEKYKNEELGFFINYQNRFDIQGIFLNETINKNIIPNKIKTDKIFFETQKKFFHISKNETQKDFKYFMFIISLYNFEKIPKFTIKQIPNLIKINNIPFNFSSSKDNDYFFYFDNNLINLYQIIEKKIVINGINLNENLGFLKLNEDNFIYGKFFIDYIFLVEGIKINFLELNDSTNYFYLTIDFFDETLEKNFKYEYLNLYPINYKKSSINYKNDFLSIIYNFYDNNPIIFYYNIIIGNNSVYYMKNFNDFEINNIIYFKESKYDKFSKFAIINTKEEKDKFLFLKNKRKSNILEDFYIDRFDTDLDYYNINNNPTIIFLRDNYEYLIILNNETNFFSYAIELLINDTEIILKDNELNDYILNNNNSYLIIGSNIKNITIISNKNSLIYIYTKLVEENFYEIINENKEENEKNFNLEKINNLFFIPIQKELNYIKITLNFSKEIKTKEEKNEKLVLLNTILDYNKIPFSRKPDLNTGINEYVIDINNDNDYILQFPNLLYNNQKENLNE